MPDDHFAVAARLRLRVQNPGHLRRRPAVDQGELCGHRYVQSHAPCTGVLDSRGMHSLTCNVGGGVDHRHNAVRDWLARLIRGLMGQAVLVEQYVTKWDRLVSSMEGDRVERARLDVAFTNSHGQRVFIDAVIATAATTNPETARSRAARDGAAAARAEDGKRVRYPGPDLVPFALEALGRPGRDAAKLLRSLAPVEPELRSVALGAAWQSLSVLLQMENAEMLLSAAGVGGGGRRGGTHQ